MGALSATAGVTGAADSAFQRRKCMLKPGLADLFEPLVIGSATAHPIEILRDNRVVGIWQRNQLNGWSPLLQEVVPTPSPTR